MYVTLLCHKFCRVQWTAAAIDWRTADDLAGECSDTPHRHSHAVTGSTTHLHISVYTPVSPQTAL